RRSPRPSGSWAITATRLDAAKGVGDWRRLLARRTTPSHVARRILRWAFAFGVRAGSSAAISGGLLGWKGEHCFYGASRRTIPACAHWGEQRSFLRSRLPALLMRRR